MNFTHAEKVSRCHARTKILAAANKARAVNLPPLRSRHLDQAVCIVRRRRLVATKVLTAAGFKATE